jgi:hypothetical protein
MADSQNALNNQTVNANFAAVRNASGAGMVCVVAAVHTDLVNPASTAELVAQSTAASGADAFINCALASTRAWGWGIDASDAESLKETTFAGGATSPSSGTLTRKVFTTGEQIMPLQPAFYAELSASDANVTGAGAVYLLGQGNVLTVTSQGSPAPITAGGLFTAPVAGFYLFTGTITVSGVTALMTNGGIDWYKNGVLTHAAQVMNSFNIASPAGTSTMNASFVINMAATDTMQLFYSIAGGVGDTVTVTGGPGQSYFTGALIC